MAEALIDTDVLYKTVTYGLISHLIHIRPYGVERYSMLGAAQFMLSKRLTKKPPSRGVDLALSEFRAAVAQCISVLEPTDAEISMAAELEYVARQLDVALDSGESLLSAILLHRDCNYIFTGDKRAIVAVGTLLSNNPELGLSGKIVCLEQLFMQMLQHDAEFVRSAVCSAPSVDKALSNCFSCHAQTSHIESWVEGLTSYIESLNQQAPLVLANTV